MLFTVAVEKCWVVRLWTAWLTYYMCNPEQVFKNPVPHFPLPYNGNNNSNNLSWRSRELNHIKQLIFDHCLPSRWIKIQSFSNTVGKAVGKQGVSSSPYGGQSGNPTFENLSHWYSCTGVKRQVHQVFLFHTGNQLSIKSDGYTKNGKFMTWNTMQQFWFLK